MLVGAFIAAAAATIAGHRRDESLALRVAWRITAARPRPAGRDWISTTCLPASRLK
jgi:hypothetical protein